MCGICGVYSYGEHEPVPKALIEAMTASLIHRGPDDSGLHFDESLALGIRRLSIIDIEGGAQPQTDESRRFWVIQNGEIYNFRELRRELESHGHVFTTQSDTESIVHAYEQWGLASFERLNGMFAIAVWDAHERRLVLARDPFGVKPLYYWDDGRVLLFGSEIRALLTHPRVERAVDLEGLHDFLDLTYVPSPRTAFAGVKKLLPGHLIVCDRRGVSMRRFHRVLPRLDRRPASELIDDLRDAIARAVERQMVADVPIGVLLSGGVDSGTVATIMTECADEPIRTFTVGFGPDFEDDELEAGRSTARRIGSDHHELLVSAEEYSAFLPRSIWHLEEPVATASTLAFYKVCELARDHVKVILTGQGADEPFSGYPRHLGERYGFLYRSLPAAVRGRVIAPLVSGLPRNEQLKRAVNSLGVSDPLERFKLVYSALDERLKNRLFGDALLEATTRTSAIDLWHADVAAVTGLDSLGQMLYIDARTSLPDNLLLYGDKLSMAVSLEARVPFLDLELMQFAESVSSNLKIRGMTQKYILKQAMSRWLPADIRRRKKIGFTTPVDGWFRNELREELEDRLLGPGSACREFFRPETVRAMIDEHRSGRHDHKRALFSLLTFELWHEQFIRPAALPVGPPGVASSNGAFAATRPSAGGLAATS